MSDIGIGWQIGARSGWGVYGYNLTVQLARRGQRPIPFAVSSDIDVFALHRPLIEPALRRHALFASLLDGQAQTLPFPILHALSDRMELPTPWGEIAGSADIGIVFFERTDIPPENLARAARLDRVVAGSAWNAAVLRDQGLGNVALCLQGVDTSLFHPAPRQNLFPGRFVVFSGGKIEFRKGQDLVAQAFRRFAERHEEALLLTAWHNAWAESVATLARSPYGAGAPATDGGRVLVADWLAAQGIDRRQVLDLGPISNLDAARVVREADVALFPNRCEGGTNLVAMECMASGVPVILSANTGHLDLLAEDGAAWPLSAQMPLDSLLGDAGLAGWGESLIDEAVARLEEAFADSERRRAIGMKGAALLAGWGWDAKVGVLLDALAPFL